jgi:hypothetical protein
VTPYEGGCLCGAVRYRVSGPATHPTLCHCSSCRRASAAPMVAWVTFPRAGFALTGEDPVRYRSSPAVVRSFCGRCGTPISYARDDEPETLDVTTTSLDRAGDFPPADHTWTEDSLPWIGSLDALPRHRRRRSDSDE